MTDEYRIPDDMHDCGDETCPDYGFPTCAEPNREAPPMNVTPTPALDRYRAAKVEAERLAPRNAFVVAAELVRHFETHRGLTESAIRDAIGAAGVDCLIAVLAQSLHREVSPAVAEWVAAERERAIEGITSNLLEDDPTD